MGKYKLIYFNARSFVEVSRILFKLNEEEFEDVRIDREKSWPDMKPNTPQGKLPILEVDGKRIVQSSAICRFLARTFDMYGDNMDEMTDIDVVLATIDDLWPTLIKIVYGETEEIKTTARKKAEDEVIPCCMNYLTGMLKTNASGWMVGEKISLADLSFFTATEQVAVVFPDFLEKYPDLTAHRNKISSIPQIKAWLTERPVTVY